MTDIDLSDRDKAFDEADPETSSFEPLPDGTYQVKVDAVELVRAKTTGNRMLKWTLKVISYPHEGRLIWKYNGFEDEKLGWLKGDLGICGLTLDRLSELPRRLRELLDIPLEVRVRNTTKNGQDYSNCYFNKRIQFNGEDVPPPKDEDAPF